MRWGSEAFAWPHPGCAAMLLPLLFFTCELPHCELHPARFLRKLGNHEKRRDSQRRPHMQREVKRIRSASLAASSGEAARFAAWSSQRRAAKRRNSVRQPRSVERRHLQLRSVAASARGSLPPDSAPSHRRSFRRFWAGNEYALSSLKDNSAHSTDLAPRCESGKHAALLPAHGSRAVRKATLSSGFFAASRPPSTEAT